MHGLEHNLPEGVVGVMGRDVLCLYYFSQFIFNKGVVCGDDILALEGGYGVVFAVLQEEGLGVVPNRRVDVLYDGRV